MSLKLFFFDLDRTLLKVNVSFAFGKYLYQKGDLPFTKMLYCSLLYARHKYFDLTLHQLQERIFQTYFCQQSITKIRHNVELFLEDNLHSLIYHPALLALQSALNAGHQVMILSSSPDFLVEPIAGLLGVDWKATRYQKDCCGRLAALENVLDGEAKAKIVKQMAESLHVSSCDIFAYSDSYLDLPFLQSAGQPVAVNPDKKLLKICHANNWQIL